MGFELINEIKKQKKWTNDDLARASGVPKATIDKLTSGTTTNPNFDTVWAIAEALGCTVDEFKVKKSPTPAKSSAGDKRVFDIFNYLSDGLRSLELIDKTADITEKQADILISVSRIIHAAFDE